MSYLQVEFTCPHCHKVCRETTVDADVDYNGVYLHCPDCGTVVAYCPLSEFQQEPLEDSQ